MVEYYRSSFPGLNTILRISGEEYDTVEKPPPAQNTLDV
jgi:hypothetical protein